MSRSPFYAPLALLAALALACGGGPKPGPSTPDGSVPTPQNRAPELELGDAVVMREGDVRTHAFSSSDPDGDAVTVSFDDLPAWITREGNALRLAPQAGDAGERLVTATVSDGSLTATDTLVISVQTAPTGTLRINGGSPYTRSASVSVQLEVIPGIGASALRDVAFSRDGLTFDAPVPFAASFEDVPIDGAADGLKTLWARVRDDAGNEAELTAQITLDRASPAVTVSAPAWVQVPSVGLSIAASDASPIAEVCYANGAEPFSECGAPVGALTWTLPSGDGAKIVRVRAVDAAGNEGFGEVLLGLDAVAPVGSVSITGGFTATRTREVQLTIAVEDAASGAEHMAFSVDDGLSWSAVVPFSGSAQLELPDADAVHPLRVRVLDRAGNVATFGAGAIRLDRLSPTGTISVTDVSPGGFVGTRNVVLALSASDQGAGVATVAFANDAEPFGTPELVQATRSWTLGAADGTRIVRMQITDVAGNTREIQTAVKLDTTPPVGTLSLQGGAAWTRTHAISLALEASDPGGGSGLITVCVKNTEGAPPPVDTCWRTYDTPLAHSLSGSDGTKTVHVYMIDRMANVGHVSASITLDTVAPQVEIEEVQTRSRTALVRWSAASDPSGITGYEVCYRFHVSEDHRCEQVGLALEHALTIPNGKLVGLGIAATDGAGNRALGPTTSAVVGFPMRETQRMPTSNALLDVHLLAAQEQIAVGERGVLLRTGSGWQTYARVDPMVDADLNAVTGEGDVVQAVGAAGTIVVSADRGQSWSRSSGPTDTLLDIEVVRTTQPWPTRRWVAVGGSGTVATVDRPRAPCSGSCPQDVWQRQTIPGVGTLRSVAHLVQGNVLIAVGDGGVILRSLDEGSSWTTVTSPVSTSLTSVTAVPGGTSFYAVSATGQLLLGAGAGATWSVVSGLSPALPGNGTMRAVKAESGGRLYLAHETTEGETRVYEITTSSLTVRTVWTLNGGAARGLGGDGAPGRVTVVGTGGLLRASPDAHVAAPSWQSPTRGTSETLLGIASSPTNTHLFAVGENGTTVYAEYQGTSWTAQTGPSTGVRRGVAILPSGVSFSVGNSGSVWRNMLPSAPWAEVGTTSHNLRAVSCVDHALCYAVGSNASIVKFNGVSWAADAPTPSTDTYLDVATYLDTSSQVRGIAITNTGAVRTNLEEVWTHRTGVSTTGLTAVAARPTGVIIMVGENGRMYRSTDHGVTWTNRTGAVGTGMLFDVLWAREGLWFVAGASGRLYRSDDDGLTWTYLETGSTSALRALAHRAVTTGTAIADHLWVAGSGGTILHSASGGR